jgi:hypothetical protein
MPIRKKAKKKPSLRTTYFNDVGAKETDKPDSRGFPKKEQRARFCAAGQVASDNRAKAYVYDEGGVLIYTVVRTPQGIKSHFGRGGDNVVPLRRKA